MRHLFTLLIFAILFTGCAQNDDSVYPTTPESYAPLSPEDFGELEAIPWEIVAEHWKGDNKLRYFGANQEFDISRSLDSEIVIRALSNGWDGYLPEYSRGWYLTATDSQGGRFNPYSMIIVYRSGVDQVPTLGGEELADQVGPFYWIFSLVVGSETLQINGVSRQVEHRPGTVYFYNQ